MRRRWWRPCQHHPFCTHVPPNLLGQLNVPGKAKTSAKQMWPTPAVWLGRAHAAAICLDVTLYKLPFLLKTGIMATSMHGPARPRTYSFFGRQITTPIGGSGRQAYIAELQHWREPEERTKALHLARGLLHLPRLSLQPQPAG